MLSGECQEDQDEKKAFRQRMARVFSAPHIKPSRKDFKEKKGTMTLYNDVQHRERMKRLVAYTSSSLTTKFPSPFGSSIYDLQTGGSKLWAYDTVMRKGDPTNHAEMNAICKATHKLQRLSLGGCILYSTCEPCPMCMSACIWTELDVVVFGASTMEDANAYWPQASDLSPE